MSFPNDLSDVVVFKIHPAVGIARISNSDQHFVFGQDPVSYKHNKIIKRQAVQFRVFAYGDNHVGLGELTPQVMNNLGITSVWSARVANRKVAKLSGTPLGGTDLVIQAEASSNDASGGQLVGSLPSFVEGASIPLGQITAEGRFIPSDGRVVRKTAQSKIIDYPAESAEVADTSCDGSVSVRLVKDGQELKVLPACIVVAPQDSSPDINEPELGDRLYNWLKNKLQIPTGNPGNLHNQTARAIDEAALQPGSARFAPGYEVCLGGSRTEVADVSQVFYHSSQDPLVDPREIRVRYRKLTDPANAGAVPGQLTSGLCSSWQGDAEACIGFWSAHLPSDAFLDEDTSEFVLVFRKQYSDLAGDVLETGEDVLNRIDKAGVVRLINNKQVETEREPGDDI